MELAKEHRSFASRYFTIAPFLYFYIYTGIALMAGTSTGFGSICGTDLPRWLAERG